MRWVIERGSFLDSSPTYFHGPAEVLTVKRQGWEEDIKRWAKYSRYGATFFTDEQKNEIGSLGGKLEWRCGTLRYKNALASYLTAKNVIPLTHAIQSAAVEISDDLFAPRKAAEDPAILLMVCQLNNICGIPYDVSPERIVDAMNVCTAACHSGGVTV